MYVRRRVCCCRDADALADLLENMSLSREQKWEGIDRELTQLRDRKGNKRMKAVIKEMGICLTDCTSRGTSLKLVLRKQKDKRTEVTVVKQFVKQKELKFFKKCLVHL